MMGTDGGRSSPGHPAAAPLTARRALLPLWSIDVASWHAELRYQEAFGRGHPRNFLVELRLVHRIG